MAQHHKSEGVGKVKRSALASSDARASGGTRGVACHSGLPGRTIILPPPVCLSRQASPGGVSGRLGPDRGHSTRAHFNCGRRHGAGRRAGSYPGLVRAHPKWGGRPRRGGHHRAGRTRTPYDYFMEMFPHKQLALMVLVVQWIAITSERREVTAVSAARATPAMGLEVLEVGPIESPRHEDTVYLPATTVPPTVVALRPKRAETAAREPGPLVGPFPHCQIPTMPIIPSNA